jgi:hypothetical protein
MLGEIGGRQSGRGREGAMKAVKERRMSGEGEV